MTEENNQLIPYRNGSKWDFCDSDKNILIKCIYDNLRPFLEGFAAVKLNSKWGYVDTAGKLVVSAIYNNAYSFNEGLAVVQTDWEWGFIDKTGKESIPCLYEDVSQFNEGLGSYAESSFALELWFGNSLVYL